MKITLPIVMKKGSEFEILLDDGGLKEHNDGKFLRIDIYPSANPIHGKRHFGFVDIPLRDLGANRETWVFDIGCFICIADCCDKEYTLGSSFFEDGESIWHFSLWDGAEMLENVISKRTYIASRDDITVSPKRFILCTSTKCNLQCGMCERANITHKPYFNTSMSTDEVAHALARFPALQEILLLGLGEPLLNEDFFEIITLCRETLGSEAQISSASNGTLLNENACEKLATSGLDGLGLSIDGASAASYEAIRRGGNFEKLYANVNRLMRTLERYEGSRRALPHVWTNFVVQPRNYTECSEFVAKFGDIGIRDMRFTQMIPYSESSKKEVAEWYAALRDPEAVFEEIAGKARTVAAEYGIRLHFETFRAPEPVEIPCKDAGGSSQGGEDGGQNLYCPYTEQGALNPDGSMDLCCVAKFSAVMTGAAHGDPYGSIRKQLVLGDWPGPCRNCGYRVLS